MIELAHGILIHTGWFRDTPIACKSPKDRIVYLHSILMKFNNKLVEFDAKKLTTSASKPFNFNASVSIAHVELFHLFFLLGMLVGKILWDARAHKNELVPFCWAMKKNGWCL